MFTLTEITDKAKDFAWGTYNIAKAGVCLAKDGVCLAKDGVCRLGTLAYDFGSGIDAKWKAGAGAAIADYTGGSSTAFCLGVFTVQAGETLKEVSLKVVEAVNNSDTFRRLAVGTADTIRRLAVGTTAVGVIVWVVHDGAHVAIWNAQCKDSSFIDYLGCHSTKILLVGALAGIFYAIYPSMKAGPNTAMALSNSSADDATALKELDEVTRMAGESTRRAQESVREAQESFPGAQESVRRAQESTRGADEVMKQFNRRY